MAIIQCYLIIYKIRFEFYSHFFPVRSSGLQFSFGRVLTKRKWIGCERREIEGKKNPAETQDQKKSATFFNRVPTEKYERFDWDYNDETTEIYVE